MFSAASSVPARQSPRGRRQLPRRRRSHGASPSIGISISSTPRRGRSPRASACVSSLEWGEGMTTQTDPLRAERVGGDQGDERRVDPARDRDQRRARSRSCARSRAGRASAPRRPRPPGRAGRPAAARPRRSARAPRAGRARGRSTPAGCADPRPLVRSARPARLGASSRSQITSSSTNWAARASVSPCAETTTLCPSKTSSSWPPTRLQTANAAPVSRARSCTICSRYVAPAAVIRRGRGVDDQARAGERLHRGGRPRVPDVLADRQPDPRPRDLDQRGGVARLEVAALVEDAVVGEQDLPVDGADLAVPEHGDGVVGGRVALGKADQRHDRPRPRRRPPPGPAGRPSRKCGFSHRSSAG